MTPKQTAPRKFTFHLFTVGVLIAGCAQHQHRGAVAMKVSEKTAHVSLGREQVAVGDSVTIFRHHCQHSPIGASKPAATEPLCTKSNQGEGKVTEVINEHYSVVDINPGVEFDEGDEVRLSK